MIVLLYQNNKMDNEIKNIEPKQIEDYVERQNNEDNKPWKIINIKLLVFITITLIAPIIIIYLDSDYFDFEDYIFWLGVTIYAESFFIYFIKKIIPCINLLYIRVLIGLILIYLYHTSNGLESAVIFIFKIFSPLLCAISFFGSQLITTITFTIQHIIKKEKIFDDEMKKTCKWLCIGLLILIGLYIAYKANFLWL